MLQLLQPHERAPMGGVPYKSAKEGDGCFFKCFTFSYFWGFNSYMHLFLENFWQLLDMAQSEVSSYLLLPLDIACMNLNFWFTNSWFDMMY